MEEEEIKKATIEDVIRKMKQNNRKSDSKLIQKAYDFAKLKHGNQLRKSGEPYIIHPVQVAYTLSTLNLDDETICAALLHDVVEDTNVTRQELAKEFGESIAEMVDGVTKLSKLQYNYRKRATSRRLQKNVFSNGKRY